MMNGEIPIVPITTLAGISSLTDLLPEMPLPTPMPQTLNNRSLLFHPRVAEEANILLKVLDDNLIPQLVQSLNQTPALNIELKVPYPPSENSLKGGPELLKAIVGKVPNIFDTTGKETSLVGSGLPLGSNNSVIVNAGLTAGDLSFDTVNSLPNEDLFSSSKDSNLDINSCSRLNDSSDLVPADKPVEKLLANTPNGGRLSGVGLHDDLCLLQNNEPSNGLSTAASVETAASSTPEGTPKKQNSTQENDKSVNRNPKNHNTVFFNKLSTKNQELMQKSLNEYVQKSVLSKVNQSNEPGENAVVEEKTEEKKEPLKESKEIKCEEENEQRTRRRKRVIKAEPENEIKQNAEEDLPKAKLRKIERKLVPMIEKLNVEELMETNTYQRFNRTIEKILEDACDDDDNDDEGSGGEEESAISKYQLGELVSEAAKLKALGAMESVPSDRLTRLLTVLERNMRVGARVSPVVGSDPNDGEEERRLFFELAMERVSRAVDASLAALYILTSPNMHKRVYLEDVIDRVVLCAKFQLHNTIYPSFDPVYRQADPAALPPNRKKRAHCKEVREKNLLLLYNKLCEVLLLLAELLDIQKLTDNSVLHTTTMGVSPFFVEGVSDLQLSALKLVTTIFMKYEKHRKLLLEDILASMARLPSSKRSLRSFRLSGEEHIQMLTALVLQLVQCVVCLPTNLDSKRHDLDPIIASHYRAAKTTATNFLYAFLGKCSSKQEEIDYRPVFENFVQDLLTTVNKPEWPAAELMLSVLGSLLVNNFVNKSLEISLRVASLDYLGVVAARLRKDTVTSATRLSKIDQLIKEIKSEEIKEEVDDEKDFDNDSEEVRTRFLQRVLLDYMAMRGQTEHSMNLARHFYIATWYQDCCNKPSTPAPKKTKNKKKRKRKDSTDEESDEPDDEETKEIAEKEKAEHNKKFEHLKRFLVSKIRPFEDKVSIGNSRNQVIQTYIDYGSAELVARYLASKRPFSQSFDTYLKHILNVLTETSVLIRTKAMKCLTSIVEVDAGVLALKDMQLGVSHSFLDHSTSVREAAVDLVGKFILSRPDLIPNYYDMLSARILDTGVSVRKRVIKILKDVCQECPDFPKIPEICVKMIRRVNDEEGIRKLVLEVFQNMWFTPVREKPMLDSDTLVRKVMNMTDVIAVSNEVSLDWLEQLLVTLVKGGDEGNKGEDEEGNKKSEAKSPPSKGVLMACKQIADCLVELVLRLDGLDNSAQRLVACHTALHLLARIHPHLLVHHAQTLQPYLSLKCQTHTDYQIISCVARTLELVVPLVEHPSETFLSRLEEDSVKLMMQQDPVVVSSCVSCLGSIVNNVTRNFALIRDCLKKYYGFLTTYRHCLEVGGVNEQTGPRFRPPFRRSLYVVGLLLRFFDFTDKEVLGNQLPESIKDDVFETFMYFLNHDEFSKHYTLKAVGNMCVRYYDMMLSQDLKELYHKLLVERDAPLPMKVQVLTNIDIYLQEEERRMIRQDAEWAKMSKQENLKEMGDLSSGMASTVVQVYLKEILESFVHSQVSVRNCALKVIQLILSQGLVHPVQIVPYLICMSSDDDKTVAHSADKQLQDIEKKYPGFIHMKAKSGIRLSFQLQRVLRDSELVRGFRVKEGEFPAALNGFLYGALRTKQQKRALLLSFLRHFDEQVKTSLSFMLYLADNLAYFPYQVQDEPLFIIHHIDIMISVTGTNLLQTFRESLIPLPGERHGEEEEEEDDDEESLLARVPEDTTPLLEALTASQGCLLLLVLKNHLKALYGFNDAKITQYSPSESNKLYDKPVNRKSNNKFDPKATVTKLQEGSPPSVLDEEARRNLILEYLEFKTLIMTLDPDDEDDGEPKEEGQLRVREIIARKVTMEEMKEGEPPRVPKLTIVRERKTTTERSPRKSDQRSRKHHRRKKKHRYSDSSDNEASDPDYYV